MLYIIVQFREPYIHRWVEADNYLQRYHRHELHFRIYIEVRHEERELEFIEVKEHLHGYFRALTQKAYFDGSQANKIFRGEASVETIAKVMAAHIQERYGQRAVIVEILEDGENGCAYLFARP